MKKSIVALDVNGKDTGLKLRFEEVHGPNSRKDLYCATSHVWIYSSKGEILLQKRAPNVSTYPDCWDISAAGHIDYGETPLQAAARETKEEIGLGIKPSELEFIKTMKVSKPVTPSWNHDEFVWVYIHKANVAIKKLSKQKEEVTSLKWISINKLLSEVHNAKAAANYVPHGKYYDLIINEITKRL